MTRESIVRVVWGVVIAAVLLCPSPVAGDQVKRLFIVHSYEEGQVCGQPQHDGVLKALDEAGWKVGQNLVLGTYYMDTKKTYTTPEQIAARGREALEQAKAFKPDVVITLDDNAVRTVMLPLVGSDIPVAEFQDLILNRVNTDPMIGAIYSIALRVEGPDGTMNNAPEVFKWQIANCTKPSMALNYFFAKLGLFGGAAVDFVAMGHQTGDKVAAIFNGTKAGDLPIEDARKYAIVFNTARARELGITVPFEILGAADFVYDTIALKPTAPERVGKSVAGRKP